MAVIELDHICKSYGKINNEYMALKETTLQINIGEFIAIMGPSGSGKSTLLHILGLLDSPSSGEYILNNQKTSNLNQKELSKLRNKEFGFIFQDYSLIEKFTALENTRLPLDYRNMTPKQRKEKALHALDIVGLRSHANKYPHQLSGGQQQRVAIARALVGDPTIILADEPTGALDQANGKQIMDYLAKVNREGKIVIIVTHDPNIANYCDRTIIIQDGTLTC